ncbi:hypothetical protein DAI22_10g063000 [Oryza sativa Japonica Group]|nr:hypothetical protein DAI22_10g063000 [Oryza sativa Japonica Group]
MEQHLFLLRLDLQKELLGELFHCCRPLLFQLCRQPHLQELQLKQHIGQRRHHRTPRPQASGSVNDPDWGDQ